MKSRMESANLSGLVKSVLAGALLVGLCPGAFAAPVGSNDVARAMKNWRQRRGTLGTKLGKTVKDVRKEVYNGTEFHVVRFEGGGHLIAPTDTKLRPVLMFSGSDDFVLDKRNPALALLMADIKAESSRLGVGADAASTASAPRSRNENEWADLLDDNLDAAYESSISDVRVAPLLKTQWEQDGTPMCFNLNTPENYPCGCVATAAAQIMKYFTWPTASLERFTSNWTQVDYDSKQLTTQGGVFDWANMPNKVTSGTTKTECQAIGKLTSDVGIILGMHYTSYEGLTWTTLGRYALQQTGYSGAMLYAMNGADGTESDFKRAMISNFNAKRPVMLGIGGHSIVGDGYGYTGNTLYYHLNMGWAGTWDYWYSTPVNADSPIAGKYTAFMSIIYNIYTEEDEDLVILSGRVTKDTAALANMPVVAVAPDGSVTADAVTDEKGIYAMLVPPGTYTVVARKDSEDHRSMQYGTATGTALECVTAENDPEYQGSTIWPYGTPALGNCADCDIAVLDAPCAPEAEVSVGEALVLTNFASATIPVTVKVLSYGPTAESADVIVTLTPVGGGAAMTQTFSIAGDFDAHTFDAAFGDLTAGGAYVVSAQVKMGGVAAKSADNGFPASRQIAWFDESAASFTSAKWSGGVVKAEDGKLSVTSSTFTPDANTDAKKRIDIKISKAKAFTEDTVPAFNSYAGVSAILRDNGQTEVVVGANGAWQPTGVFFTDADLAFNAVIELDFDQHTVRYSIGSTVLGTYDLSTAVASVSSIAFKGTAALSAFSGAGVNANLVKDAAGNEYATFEAAKAAGATGVLSPLWKSTWDLGNMSGTLDVNNPDDRIVFTGESKVVKSDKLGDNNERLWFAKVSDEDVPSAGKYIKTTVDLGLAKAITDASVVQIGDFAVANGAMSFKVKIDDVEIAKATVTELVEVSDDLVTWPKPAATDISFNETTHIITVNPPTGEDVNSGFTRVKIEEEQEEK